MSDDPPAKRKAYKSTLKSRLSPEDQQRVREAAVEGKRHARERSSAEADEQADGDEAPVAIEEQLSEAAAPEAPVAGADAGQAAGSDEAPTVRHGKGAATDSAPATLRNREDDAVPSGAGASDRTSDGATEGAPESDSVESVSPLKTTLTSPVDDESARQLREAAEAAQLEVGVEDAMSSREPEPSDPPVPERAQGAAEVGAADAGQAEPVAVTRRDRPLRPVEDQPLEPSGAMVWRIVVAVVLAAIAAAIILRLLSG